MTIRITCAECASVLKIKDELAGTSAKCPKCKTPFVIPAITLESESTEPIAASSDLPNSETARIAQDEAAPLSLGTEDAERPADVDPQSQLDSHEDHSAFFGDPTSESDPAQTESDADTSESEYEDLDCSPVLISPPSALPVSESASQSEQPPVKQAFIQTTEKVAKNQPNLAKMPAYDIETPRSLAKKKSDDAFDPMAYLMEESPKQNRQPPRSSLQKDFDSDIDDDSDLSLPDDSDYDILDRPSPVPERRRPSPTAARPTPEKVDLASAAKMMKKAIKDAQTDSVRQRKIDEGSKYDYMLFFREIGYRGLAIICGLVVLVLGAVMLSNYVYRSTMKTPKLGIVRGTIKLNGQPMSNAIICFSPNKDLEQLQLKGSKRDRERPSLGMSDQQGNFRMMYSRDENIEGVAVGPCRVWVTHPGANDVPRSWGEAGMKEYTVTEGRQKEPFNIDMKTENPN